MTGNEHQLAFEWVDGAPALQDITDEWSLLAGRVGADIYAHPEWVMTWWAHFGQARQLKTLVVREQGGQLAGLIPFMIHSIRLGPVSVRVAKLTATDPNTVIFRLATEEAALTAGLEKAFLDLLSGHDRVHLISFTPASERGDILGAVRDAAARATSAAALSLVDTPSGTHTVFELPETFDAYLSALSKKRRNQYRRDLKRLQGDHGLTTHMSHPDAQAFENFVRFHTQQWQEVGKGGHFADWPGSANFYSHLAETAKRNGTVWFVEQLGPETTLATQFCLVAGQVCHWRLPARSTNPEMERLSLGKVGLIQMTEKLIEAGITRIEAGIGAYGYKLVYGGESVPIYRLIIARQGGWSFLMVKLCLGWARILHLAYYRLWFGRITPRLRSVLPLKHKPLWAAWIKTRI